MSLGNEEDQSPGADFTNRLKSVGLNLIQSDSWLSLSLFVKLAPDVAGLVFTNIVELSLVIDLKVVITLRPLSYLSFVLNSYSQRVTLLRLVYIQQHSWHWVNHWVLIIK